MVTRSCVPILSTRVAAITGGCLLALFLTACGTSEQPVAEAPPPPGQVIGVGGFSHIVADHGPSIAFYVDAMGLTFRRPLPAEFGMPEWIEQMGNTPPGALSKPANLDIPGSALGIELIAYQNVEVHPVRPRWQDPGAATLVVHVRDLDTMRDRLVAAGGTVVPANGQPDDRELSFEDGSLRRTRSLLLTDPDGFYVELVETTPVLPTEAPAESNVIGAGFRITVDNLDETMEVYRDVLGFANDPEYPEVEAYLNHPPTPGWLGEEAAQRFATASIPGTEVEMSWEEFSGVERTPARSSVPDPGTPILQLQVADAAAATQALKDAGWEVISRNGEIVPREDGGAFVIVRDPNNLFLELFQRAQN